MIKKITITWFAPARLMDLLRVKTFITRFGNSSMWVEQVGEVIGEETNTHVADFKIFFFLIFTVFKNLKCFVPKSVTVISLPPKKSWGSNRLFFFFREIQRKLFSFYS